MQGMHMELAADVVQLLRTQVCPSAAEAAALRAFIAGGGSPSSLPEVSRLAACCRV